MSENSFAGRVAIVTGAGAGLGRAYAIELARRGASVVVNDLGGTGDGNGMSTNAAAVVVAEINASGGRAVASFDSVATRAGGRAIVDTALDTFGRLDALIANAGILRTGRFDELTDEDIDKVIDVHLKSGFYVGQPAFSAMKKQRYGRILFTASSSGMFGHPWQASYAAAKAGTVGLANVVALEGKEHGILCNVIMPNASTRLADEIDWTWAHEVKDVGAALAQLVGSPAGGGDRLNPQWVVPLAVELVSERSMTTHQLFSACSGRFARVFIGVAEGWAAPNLPSAEDISAHWSDICAAIRFSEPQSVYGEAQLARDAVARLSLG
jgi:NAD(P)-dependent dehydrogenase (short-subunit alcohol dehydrogenase family)